MIEITNLSKTYAGGFQALTNIDLSIKEGEIFALLGPNGAGKTTLIGAICGLVTITEGSVSVGGFDNVTEAAAARRLVGLVPQEIMFDMFSTPLEEMDYARGYAGLRPDQILSEKILKDLSLWDKRNSQLQSLSGGMKRRFLIARALATEPKILFLDEPTAGVDVELRRETAQIIKNLAENGTTIVLTTHYIDEAEELADRVGVISDGKILLVEEKDSLMQRLGNKTMTITLASPLEQIPESLSSFGLTLNDETSLSYEYQPGDETGIAKLLSEIKSAGISVSDIDTEASSLEEIFVDLVKNKHE